MQTNRLFLLPLFSILASRAFCADALPGTQPLTMTGDFSAQMVAGIEKFLDRELEASVSGRAQFWKRDFASPEAYEKSIAPNRERLRKIIGAVDARVPVKELEFVGGTSTPSKVGETESYAIHAVRWPVFEGVFGEGLLLEPKGEVAANVIALADADQTPEQLCGLAAGVAPESQFARRLAAHGCRVLVPMLLSRDDTFSGSRALDRWTNLPHREWIWRMAYELGRTTTGYEVQKILAGVDWFANRTPDVKVGVAGHGEGALIAFHAAALDPRIHATLVSGYFDSRQRVWSEPAYRNVFGLLREFGDAEIASLIAPRALIIEHSPAPQVDGPPPARDNRRACAAPGKIITPELASVEVEVARAKSLVGRFGISIQLIRSPAGLTTRPGSDRALLAFLKALEAPAAKLPLGPVPANLRKDFDPIERQHRQVTELEDFTQDLLHGCERTRAANFWNTIKATDAESWTKLAPQFRQQSWEQVLGKFPAASLTANPRTRKLQETDRWTSYDVVLDVWPDVFAWGALLLPKDIKPGERRPVVVCQHGAGGLPEDTITDDPSAPGYHYYKAFAARLADRGFIVFAPHNPYRGGDSFRVLQRKANPLGKSLFSVILAQHDRILDWLSAQPFVDPQRIGFYGLSYGGKSAMRLPALLDRYCLSICSGDFNEWVRKNAGTDYPNGYLFTGEYEIYEWNLGHTFSYAEMAALIAPRPFMVEKGHADGVATDEWTGYEYERVRRFYDRLGIGDRTEIEYFNGPHTINGKGSFEFLHKHLNWPKTEP